MIRFVKMNDETKKYIAQECHKTKHMKEWLEKYDDLKLMTGANGFKYLSSPSVNSIANAISFEVQHYGDHSMACVSIYYDDLNCEECKEYEAEGISTIPSLISLFIYSNIYHTEPMDFFNYEEVLNKNNFSQEVKTKIKEELVRYFQNVDLDDVTKKNMPDSLLRILNFS